MSFRDRTTGAVLPEWQACYDYSGMPVPEGEPGSNSGDISLAARLSICLIEGNIPGLVV